MLGGDVPDLAKIPCVGCGEQVDPEVVVWDAWHRGDHRFAAMPYHRDCAAAILPPEAPAGEMNRCDRCGEDFAQEVLKQAFEELHARFRAPKARLATPELVWRLASREPRAYLAEHLACLMGAVRRKPPTSQPPQP